MVYQPIKEYACYLYSYILMIFISILIMIVALALPSTSLQQTPILFSRISAISLIYAGMLAFNTLYIQSIGSGIGTYSGFYVANFITQSIEMFLMFIAACILIAKPHSVHSTISVQLSGRYALVILFSTLGSILLISSGNMISMYLGIELQSFGLYVLATLFRDSHLATSAGLKYFLLGGLSSSIILFGAAIIYTQTGLTNLEEIYQLASAIPSDSGIILGFCLVIVGFLFKIAAAPLHHWAPDVYNDSPTIVTIWLTIIPKIAIFIFLFDFISGGISTHLSIYLNQLLYADLLSPELVQTKENVLTLYSGNIIQNILLVSALLSLIIGTLVGLVQTKIKRLLAYSTVSHIGFMLLALTIISEQSIEAFLFYIIQYTLTNLNTFLIILAYGYILKLSLSQIKTEQEKDILYISELKGQFIINPLLSICLAICLFSMAGIPPLIGFFSKQMVLYSALQQGFTFMAITGIIVSIISAYYYLHIVRILFTESDPMYTSNVTSNLSGIHSYLISVLTLALLLFVLNPSILLNSTQLDQRPTRGLHPQ